VTVSRQDILEVYSLLKDKLVHVHLSDNAGDGRDGHLELEQGVLPIERFLSELRRTGYSKAVSLELAVHRYVDNHQNLVDMLRRNREYVERILGQEEKIQKGMPRNKPSQKVS
jgi:sugar phosphate isomerase/epimerase